MSRFCAVIAVTCFLCTSYTKPLLAQPNSRLAINDAAKADEDFAWQGEFSGKGFRQTKKGWRPSKFGLQLVAHGAGEFLGRIYVGGLPGSGWNREQQYVVTGKKTGDKLLLTGEGFQVDVGRNRAKLSALEPLLVAELNRVIRRSPTLGKQPPAGALVIFDGKPSEFLKNAKVSEDGLLQEGCEITALANDFTLHLEFRLPYMPYARGQGRSNSGVYIHGRYEVQVLDSFGLGGEFNECGALYRYKTPDLNMCLSPLVWQTYDILYLAPRFDADGNKTQNARIWVHHNGVPVQNGFELERATGAGQRIGEGPQPRPIKLQNHSNPVRFRNIWMIKHDRPGSAEQSAPSSAAPATPALTAVPRKRD